MSQLSKYLIQIWMISLFWHRHKEICWPNKPQCPTFRTHYKNSFWTASLCLLFSVLWPSGVKSLFFFSYLCVYVCLIPCSLVKSGLALELDCSYTLTPPSEPVAIAIVWHPSGVSGPLSDTPTLSVQHLFLCCSYLKKKSQHLIVVFSNDQVNDRQGIQDGSFSVQCLCAGNLLCYWKSFTARGERRKYVHFVLNIWSQSFLFYFFYRFKKSPYSYFLFLCFDLYSEASPSRWKPASLRMKDTNKQTKKKD